jgi:phage tail-like protein
MSGWTRPSMQPLMLFNFDVVFHQVALPDVNGDPDTEVRLCAAAFSEVTGLEATMEPKVIKEGGRNFGVVQRVGPVTFATVVLKRGVSDVSDLWKWFELVAGGATRKRLTATITVYDAARVAQYRWKLHRALPTKFKSADLNATTTSIGVEELHIAHEGLEWLAVEKPAPVGDFPAPAPGGGMVA